VIVRNPVRGNGAELRVGETPLAAGFVARLDGGGPERQAVTPGDKIALTGIDCRNPHSIINLDGSPSQP